MTAAVAQLVNEMLTGSQPAVLKQRELFIVKSFYFIFLFE